MRFISGKFLGIFNIMREREGERGEEEKGRGESGETEKGPERRKWSESRKGKSNDKL